MRHAYALLFLAVAPLLTAGNCGPTSPPPPTNACNLQCPAGLKQAMDGTEYCECGPEVDCRGATQLRWDPAAQDCKLFNTPCDVPSTLTEACPACLPDECGERPGIAPRVCEDEGDGHWFIEKVEGCERIWDGSCEWQLTQCTLPGNGSHTIACEANPTTCPDSMACIRGECYAGDGCGEENTVWCGFEEVCCRGNNTCTSVDDWATCPATPVTN